MIKFIKSPHAILYGMGTFLFLGSIGCMLYRLRIFGKRLFWRTGQRPAVRKGIFFVTDFGAVRNGVFRAVFFCLFYNNFTLF